MFGVMMTGVQIRLHKVDWAIGRASAAYLYFVSLCLLVGFGSWDEDTETVVGHVDVAGL